MAVLTYSILAQDVSRWATLALIKATLQVDGTKLLEIALDPLIDPSVVNPSQAYQVA